MTKNIKINPEKPFNELPLLSIAREKLESIKVLRQLIKSSTALAELKGFVKILPNPNILLNAVILKEASASSEIENVITTQDKLYQALTSKGINIDSSTKEVLRYREAMLFGYDFIQKKGFLTTNAILDIQKILEQSNAGIRKIPGTALRNASTGMIIYTPPDNFEAIIHLMKNLEQYINEEDDVSPLIKLAVQHYQFESIHPFYDGNGRTGRIINILYLILHNLLESPILYLSRYIIDYKSDYYRLLQEVRTNNNWEPWIIYILKGIEQTANNTITQVNEINTLFFEIQDKVKRYSPKVYSKELIELIFEQPYCKIEYLTKKNGITRITASKYLKELEKIKILESKKVWKETLYINTHLFQLLRK